jgi:hypothetical protein
MANPLEQFKESGRPPDEVGLALLADSQVPNTSSNKSSLSRAVEAYGR